MKHFRIIVDTGFVGAQHEDEVEFPDWDEMTEVERQEALEQACQDAVANHIEAYWEESQ